MVPRIAVPLVLLAACVVAFSQTSSQPDPNTPKYFHDATSGVSYFYPGRFTPEAAGLAKNEGLAKCAQPTLAGSSVTPVGVSAFVFSTIGSACPGVLHSAATKLDEFTREQVLNQLKQYGKPVVMQDPTSYTIDGHPAMVTIASVQQSTRIDLNSIAHPKMIYAAKACVLGNIPPRHSKSSLADATKRVFCFDYTTHEHDLLPVMLAFTMQFDGQGPQPVVPGGILH